MYSLMREILDKSHKKEWGKNLRTIVSKYPDLLAMALLRKTLNYLNIHIPSYADKRQELALYQIYKYRLQIWSGEMGRGGERQMNL
jgi:hypothetical protein